MDETCPCKPENQPKNLLPPRSGACFGLTVRQVKSVSRIVTQATCEVDNTADRFKQGEQMPRPI